MNARHLQRLSEFLVGLLFGWGLLISGMTDPGKVLGFLDLAGAWDPSLALVMGGAIAIGSLAFAWVRRRSANLLGGPLRLPTSTRIDRRLWLGSLVFGMGWGLAGICPGPGLVAMAAGHREAAVFVGAMLAGMLLFEAAERWSRRSTNAPAT